MRHSARAADGRVKVLQIPDRTEGCRARQKIVAAVQHGPSDRAITALYLSTHRQSTQPGRRFSQAGALPTSARQGAAPRSKPPPAAFIFVPPFAAMRTINSSHSPAVHPQGSQLAELGQRLHPVTGGGGGGGGGGQRPAPCGAGQAGPRCKQDGRHQQG